MQNKYMKIAAKVSAAATILAMFATVSPAMAAGTATSPKDTLTREKISVAAVGHVVTMTLPSAQTGTLTLTYPSFTAFAFTSATCGGGTAVDAGTATNVVSLTLTACTTPLTVNFTGTNPGTAGSYAVAFGGTAALTGSYAVPITDEDQITVTATVDPSITFDLSAQTAACAYGALANTYLVALGTLSTGSVSTSDVGGVQAICVQLDTNAANGAVVTVKNDSPAAGADGDLASTSVPTDFLPPNTGAVNAGTSGWGMCINLVSSAATTPSGTFRASGAGQDDWGGDSMTSSGSTDTSTTCTSTLHGTTTAFDGSTQDVLNTSTDGVGQGLARILVKASISGTQPAHTDYNSTLTFIATGTF